jgi:crossover junction endodeoxyribonuclease RuvC
MIFLGIDPGTATTGFALLQTNKQQIQLLEYGCIKTSPATKMSERLNEIHQNLDEIIKKFKPQKAAVEEIFFSTNIKTAIQVAQARGVILQKLASHQIEIFQFNPLQIKNSVCGYGSAKKPEIQKMIQLIFKLENPPKPDDAADAIAIAYTLILQSRFSIPPSL